MRQSSLVPVAETAVNIGYSCKLLTDDMEEPFIVDAEGMEEVEVQLKQALDEVKSARLPSGPVVSFVNGRTVMHDRMGTEESTCDVEDEDEFGDFALIINGHSLVG